jgi:hypothetical protein
MAVLWLPGLSESYVRISLFAEPPASNLSSICHAEPRDHLKINLPGQVFVPVRNMKLSYVNSATCHHRYASLRNATIDSQTFL